MPFIAELAAISFTVEFRVDPIVIPIHPPIPGLCLPAEIRKRWNASLPQALPRENPDFDLCLIQPTSMAGCVMDGEAAPDRRRHFRSEHSRQRFPSVDIEVIHH
jgi:hypothetical protein